MKCQIGTRNKEVPALGMGCWAIGGQWTIDWNPMGWHETNESESRKAIEAAYVNGIRVFDTAANYGAGLSERLLGEVLHTRRSDCFIATKFGFIVDEENKNVTWPDKNQAGLAARRVIGECEDSLRRLNTDYIDLYLFHQWEWDPEEIPELCDNLDKLVQQGKIRNYGWSTDDPSLASLMAERENCQAMEITMNAAHENRAMASFCEKNNLTALIKSPLAMGFLSGKYTGKSNFDSTDVRSQEWPRETFQKPVTEMLESLKEVLTSKGRTLVQGALAWLWAKNHCILPIPGIRTAAQAEENAGAMAFGPLSPAEMEQIRSLKS